MAQKRMQSKTQVTQMDRNFRESQPSTLLIYRRLPVRMASRVRWAWDMDAGDTCGALGVGIGADRPVRISPRWNSLAASALRVHRLHRARCVRVFPIPVSSGTAAVFIKHEAREGLVHQDIKGRSLFHPGEIFANIYTGLYLEVAKTRRNLDLHRKRHLNRHDRVRGLALLHKVGYLMLIRPKTMV